MSNPRSKPVPALPKPQSRSPVIKNPPRPRNPPSRPPAKHPSGPSKPAPTGLKPTLSSTKNPSAKPTPVTSASSTLPSQQGPRADNWLNRTVQNSIAGVGNYAGSWIYSISNSVNKVGEGVGTSIGNTTRGWGHGVAGYGNGIKDAVGVGGKRVSTAGNPLGLAGQGASQGGKIAKGGTTGTKKGSAANPLGL